MPLYYYDEQGYKIGPISKKELFTLAENGKIAPETHLTDGSRETQAKHVPGLKFIAAEYYQAEEIFDPKNYTLNIPETNMSTASIYSDKDNSNHVVPNNTTQTSKQTPKKILNNELVISSFILITTILLTINTIASLTTCVYVVRTIHYWTNVEKELEKTFKDFDQEVEQDLENQNELKKAVKDFNQQIEQDIKQREQKEEQEFQKIDNDFRQWQIKAKEQFNAGATKTFDKSLDLHSKLQLEIGVPIITKFQFPENRRMILQQIQNKNTWDITILDPKADNPISSKQIKGKFEKYQDGQVSIRNGNTVQTLDIKYFNPLEQSLIGLYQQNIGQPIPKINR
jgi:Skp family chaperone for outer membrane proteins